MKDKRNKIINKKTITFIGIFPVLFSVQLIIVCLSFPFVKLTVKADQTEEKLCVYYAREQEEFCDENMSNIIITNPEKQQYCLDVEKEVDRLRIDIGTGEGKSVLYDVELKISLFQKIKLRHTDIESISYSADVGEVLVDEDALIIESIGYDPHIIMRAVDENIIFDWSGVCVLFFISLMAIVATSVICILIFYGKDIIKKINCGLKRGYTFVKKIDKKKKAFGVVFFILFLAQFIIMCTSFPVVRLSFAADEVGENICLFYGQTEEAFSEDRMSYTEIFGLGRQTYYLKTDREFEKIRVDIGNGAGKACVYGIDVKTSLFSKNEINLTNLDTISVSGDVDKLYIEDHVLIIESIGNDPFIILTDIDGEIHFDWHGFLAIGLIAVSSFFIAGIVYVIIFKSKKIIVNAIRFFENNRISLFFVCGLFVSVLFFSLPIMFTYDSATYMAYFDIFDKELALSQWGKTRGWGFPLFLWSAANVFGNTAYGMNVALFILYALFIICLYLIGKKSISKSCNVFFSLLFFVFIILNPIVLGYFHIILTECLTAAIVCMTEIILLFLHIRDVKTKEKKFSILKIVLIICSCIILYFVKQMFFVIPLISYFLLELSMIIHDKRKIIFVFIGTVTTLLLLVISIKTWEMVIADDIGEEIVYQDKTSTIMQQLDISSSEAFSVYLKKGAIYFEENGTDIWVYDNGNVIDVIKNTENLDTISYLLACIKSHPIKLLQGYLDNYLVLANIYQLEIPENYLMSEADIIKEVSFGAGLENVLLAEYPRYYASINNTYEELGTNEEMISLGQYVDDNFVIGKLYNKDALFFNNCLYTIVILYAPISMVLHAILFVREWRKYRTNSNSIIFSLAGTVFFYGVALSVMCMRIDRYMFPVFGIGIIVLIADIMKLGECIYKGCRVIIKKGKKIESTNNNTKLQ